MVDVLIPFSYPVTLVIFLPLAFYTPTLSIPSSTLWLRAYLTIYFNDLHYYVFLRSPCFNLPLFFLSSLRLYILLSVRLSFFIFLCFTFFFTHLLVDIMVFSVDFLAPYCTQESWMPFWFMSQPLISLDILYFFFLLVWFQNYTFLFIFGSRVNAEGFLEAQYFFIFSWAISTFPFSFSFGVMSQRCVFLIFFNVLFSFSCGFIFPFSLSFEFTSLFWYP